MSDCNCGHGCGCNHNEKKYPSKIYLTLLDNSKLECDVLDVFTLENKEYIGVLPQNSETALLYLFSEGEEGPELTNIESDEEYQRVSEVFLNKMGHR